MAAKPDKFICVYCGSGFGNRPEYSDAAIELGKQIVKYGYGLVYGGSKNGIMGKVAEGVASAGGYVIGVMPEFMQRYEHANTHCSEMRIVDSMHERKAQFAKTASAFIALPGGLGTLEEVVEMVTWNQLNIQHKPIGLLNINGFYEHLLAQLKHMEEEGFLHHAERLNILVVPEPISLVKKVMESLPSESPMTGNVDENARFSSSVGVDISRG
eukprot:Clim_evm23s168 gene=Clim_evmTU23s168